MTGYFRLQGVLVLVVQVLESMCFLGVPSGSRDLISGIGCCDLRFRLVVFCLGFGFGV